MIIVKYSCKVCGLDRVEVSVPARNSPNSDVKAYVEQAIGQRVRRDHHRRSPSCLSDVMSEVMIPLPKEDDPNPWIGKQT
jgi:hypothetical protein